MDVINCIFALDLGRPGSTGGAKRTLAPHEILKLFTCWRWNITIRQIYANGSLRKFSVKNVRSIFRPLPLIGVAHFHFLRLWGAKGKFHRSICNQSMQVCVVLVSTVFWILYSTAVMVLGGSTGLNLVLAPHFVLSPLVLASSSASEIDWPRRAQAVV